jgi:hypothetical protein
VASRYSGWVTPVLYSILNLPGRNIDDQFAEL